MLNILTQLSNLFTLRLIDLINTQQNNQFSQTLFSIHQVNHKQQKETATMCMFSMLLVSSIY